jgi:hypothetical protein
VGLSIIEIGASYLHGLASNCDPPDLCLLSSCDYRYEPLVPGSVAGFYGTAAVLKRLVGKVAEHDLQLTAGK